MYLSRLTLNPRHGDTRRWLGDCHLLHRRLMSAFDVAEGGPARDVLGVLFRVEMEDRGRLIHVIAQSIAKPDWSRLVSAAVTTVEGPKSLDALMSSITPGAHYRFRLRANPTRRVHERAFMAAHPGRREYAEASRWVGKRVDLRREEDRLAWLERRGTEHDGFALAMSRLLPADRVEPIARADPAARLVGTRPASEDRVTLATALFEGVLVVTDVNRFRAGLEHGIGPGKAFGCGLLSIAPIRA